MDNNKDNIDKSQINRECYKSLIQELKKERIQLNKTVEEVSKELLVSFGTVEKLEEGKIIGNSSYMRMILRKYITTIGLDYKDYEEKIKKEFPSLVEETIVLNELKSENLKKLNKEKDFKIIKKISAYLVFIIFIVFLVLITVYNFKNEINKSETINETTQIKATILEPEKVIEKPVQDLEVKVVDNNIEVYLKDTDSVNVKIHTTGQVYLDYSKDGVIQKQSTLAKNQNVEYEFKSIDNLKINIGSIEKAEITINDKDISKEVEDLAGHYYVVFKQQES